MKYKKLIVALLISIFLGILLFGGGYTYWNSAGPDRTCANCHEIRQSVSSFHLSGHRELSCSECHGTALSNGIHSLKEKSNMLFAHVKDSVEHNDIRLNEAQVLDLSSKCTKCHQSEYKNWLSGGHSTTYKDIFLDSVHNSMEAPYPDCFRCHGMFYEKTITDLIEPISKEGPWHLKEANKEADHAIPCLACHQIHTDNEVLSKLTMDSLGYQSRNPVIALYLRSDKIHQRADKLFKTKIFHNGVEVKTSDDYAQSLCVNCHSPNSMHAAGSQDDRTPIGVHEGLSCTACHKAHSNDARGSCVTCHPAISNCKLDVKKMNTTYFDAKSPNNIHFVACKDCHTDQKINFSFRKKDLSISSLLN